MDFDRLPVKLARGYEAERSFSASLPRWLETDRTVSYSELDGLLEQFFALVEAAVRLPPGSERRVAFRTVRDFGERIDKLAVRVLKQDQILGTASRRNSAPCFSKIAFCLLGRLDHFFRFVAFETGKLYDRHDVVPPLSPPTGMSRTGRRGSPEFQGAVPNCPPAQIALQ